MAIFVIENENRGKQISHFMDGRNRKAGDYIACYGKITRVLCELNCGQKNPGGKIKFRECFSDHKCIKLEELRNDYNKNQTEQGHKHS